MPDQPDFEFCKASIDDCRRNHALSARRSPLANALRRIDCETRRLVVSEEHHPYICLSYLWGHGAIGTTQFNDQLPPDLPKAIEDTLFVVLELGIPFIWVDRYCINQNNATEKHTIIGNMDRIYQDAELTMMAIGADSNDGLPGVRGTPRVAQCRPDIVQKIYLGVPVMNQEIKKSSTTIPYSLQDLSALLSEYYKRQLSFNTDTIHAITGIINNFQYEAHASLPIDYSPPDESLGYREAQSDVATEPAKNFHGLPVIHYSRDADNLRQSFLHYLQWTVRTAKDGDTSLLPSDLFPSWSRASAKATRRPDAIEWLNMPPTLGIRPGYGKSWNYMCIEVNVEHVEDGTMSIAAFPSHGDDYMSFGPWIDVTTWTLCLKLNTNSSKVRIMSNCYDAPEWAAHCGGNVLAVFLSLGIQSTYEGHPDQLLVNGLLVAEKEQGLYRRIEPFHTGCVLNFKGMSAESKKDWDYALRSKNAYGCVLSYESMGSEAKRKWQEAMRLMNENDGIVTGETKSLSEKGWFNPAILAQLPVESWTKETTLRLLLRLPDTTNLTPKQGDRKVLISWRNFTEEPGLKKPPKLGMTPTTPHVGGYEADSDARTV
ncbi:heterokaryon incompatibility protein-domain-containing protein [Phaeosphaeria sp. MPI-PUGE-AT-0046c]|nr:heterokaryon incompatibility protein-domain-containing protein [Phaeosphaeria sp. MPI-PUGE-AT-0046c]